MTGREKDDAAIRFHLPTEWTASRPKPETSQIQNAALPKMLDIQSLQGTVHCRTPQMSDTVDPECREFLFGFLQRSSMLLMRKLWNAAAQSLK